MLFVKRKEYLNKDLYPKTLKELLGENQFNEHKEIINYILETLIFISKTHKVIGLNEKSFLNNCCK